MKKIIKKLLIIPILFISTFGYNQVTDTIFYQGVNDTIASGDSTTIYLSIDSLYGYLKTSAKLYTSNPSNIRIKMYQSTQDDTLPVLNSGRTLTNNSFEVVFSENVTIIDTSGSRFYINDTLTVLDSVFGSGNDTLIYYLATDTIISTDTLLFSILSNNTIYDETLFYFKNRLVALEDSSIINTIQGEPTDTTYKLNFLLSRATAGTRLNSVVIGSVGDTVDVNNNTTLIEFSGIHVVNDSIKIVVDTVNLATFLYINAFEIINEVTNDTVKVNFTNTSYLETGWINVTTLATTNLGICTMTMNSFSVGTSGYIPNTYPNNVAQTYNFNGASATPLRINLFGF